MSESLIATVKRLAELEGKAPPSNDISKEFVLRYMHDAWGLREKDLNLIIALRNAAPSMFAVLGAFKENDAKLIDDLIGYIERRDICEDFYEHRKMLVRLCHAAAKMEQES